MPAPQQKPPTSSPPNVTRRDIELYNELGDLAREAEARARGLRKQQGELAGKLMAFVAAKGGKQREVSRSGYRLAILTVAKAVRWKDAFVAKLGLTEAEKLTRAAGTTDRLSVEKE